MKKTISILLLLLIVIISGCRFEKQIIIYGPDEVEIGKSIYLQVNTNTDVIWSSEDENIAIVDNKGNVTGISEGKTLITVRKVSNYNLSETIEINVILSNSDDSIRFEKTKILSINDEANSIELLNTTFSKYTTSTKFYHLIDNMVIPISIQDIYVGMENVYISGNNETNEIDIVLVDGKIGFSNIRVAIRNSINDIANISTLYHNSATLVLNSNTVIQTFDGEDSLIISGGRLDISVANNNIKVVNNGITLLETNKRIIMSSNSSIQITSIIRNNGNPTYEGNLELSLVDSKLLIVNDVNIENYLTKVVPSEMPSTFHHEALRAQAIAARTFAYRDIFNKANEKNGYVVDDSVKSQVYNNQSPNIVTTQAVAATKGLIMTVNNKPIPIYYYSTSSGLTASAHEVWFEGGNEIAPIPGLIGQNFAYDPKTGEKINFDYQDENNMLAFFKLIKINTPDNSPYHRWKIPMTPLQLQTTINANLKITYQNSPQSTLTFENNKWVSKPIPNNIGSILDIYVDRRGESGVVMSLVIKTTSGIFKIINQYNIRFTIRPKDAGSIVIRSYARNIDNTYTGKVNNDSILPSGFFAITREGNNFVFYGGGNGHGVGMSQYGADGLGRDGYTYEQILTAYYHDVNLSDIGFFYYERDDIKSIFEDLEIKSF